MLHCKNRSTTRLKYPHINMCPSAFPPFKSKKSECSGYSEVTVKGADFIYLKTPEGLPLMVSSSEACIRSKIGTEIQMQQLTHTRV